MQQINGSTRTDSIEKDGKRWRQGEGKATRVPRMTQSRPPRETSAPSLTVVWEHKKHHTVWSPDLNTSLGFIKKITPLWKPYSPIIPPLLPSPSFLPLHPPFSFHSSHISDSVFDIKVGWRLKSGWRGKSCVVWGSSALGHGFQTGLDPQSYSPSACSLLVSEDGWEMKLRFCFLSSKLTYSMRHDSCTLAGCNHSSGTLRYPVTSLALTSGFKQSVSGRNVTL